MIEVTMQEACQQLPQLLILIANGEQVIIAENGKWLATLAAPPPSSDGAVERVAAQSRAELHVRQWFDQAAREQRLPSDIPATKAG
jgi:antitoxin (DNA-binding transcriptional repressor) of toxin-antitoxin stability system